MSRKEWKMGGIVGGIIVIGVLSLWNAPNSFWDGIRVVIPEEHYEAGERIRTIRGQDFIVTGYGSDERLVPLAPESQQTTIVIVKTNYVRVE